MGASEFEVTITATTAKEAFRLAVEDARYEHGNGGYTGTIAEKDSFLLIDTAGKDPKAVIQMMVEKCASFETCSCRGDRRYFDKWGPALCVRLDKNTFLFFGMASS